VSCETDRTSTTSRVSKPRTHFPTEGPTIPPRHAFLDAILADRDDDAVRLIYADWLDDHGEPERAEFIRLQCRLARMSWHDDNWPDLHEREQQFLTERSRYWGRKVGAGMKPVFRRGFVDEVTLLLADFPDRATTLFREPVRRINLTGYHHEDHGLDPVRRLAACPHLARIEGLNLYDVTLGADGAELLFASPHLALRSVHLGDEDGTVPVVEALVRAAWLPGLRELAVWGFQSSDLGDAGAAMLAEAAGLRTLDLFGNRIGPAGATALAASPHLAGLTALYLGRSQCGYTTNRIGPAGAVALSRAAFCPNLEVLSLDLCGIEPHGLGALAAAPLDRLRELHVRGNDLRDVGVWALADAAWTGSLRMLQLGHNDIGDAGLAALAGADLSGVQYLWLLGNRLGPASGPALAKLAQLPGLREVNLAGNPLGDAGVRAVLSADWPAGLRLLYLNHVEMNTDLRDALTRRFGERVRV